MECNLESLSQRRPLFVQVGGGLFTVVDTVRVFDDQHDLEVPPTPDATLMGHRDIILTQPTAAKDMAQFWHMISVNIINCVPFNCL